MSRRNAATAGSARKSGTAHATKAEPKPPLTIIQACEDPQIFASWFKNRATWAAWFVFLRAMFGLALQLPSCIEVRALSGSLVSSTPE
jgi:hypothetical protein